MVFALFLSTALIAGFCTLAYRLAVYALPFMIGIYAMRVSYDAGAGAIGSMVVGMFVGGASYGFLVGLFQAIRQPVFRIILALVFVTPAAIVGYSIVHDLTAETVPSPVFQQLFSIVAGACVAWSALLRLVAPIRFEPQATP